MYAQSPWKTQKDPSCSVVPATAAPEVVLFLVLRAVARAKSGRPTAAGGKCTNPCGVLRRAIPLLRANAADDCVGRARDQDEIGFFGEETVRSLTATAKVIVIV